MSTYPSDPRGFRRARCVSAAGLWLAVVLAAGCATGGSSAREAATRNEIEESLRRDPLVERIPVEVRVDGGDVVLYGNVRTGEESQRVEEIAKRTPGVRSVENHLRVAPGGGIGGSVPSEILLVPGSSVSP